MLKKEPSWTLDESRAAKYWTSCEISSKIWIKKIPKDSMETCGQEGSEVLNDDYFCRQDLTADRAEVCFDTVFRRVEIQTVQNATYPL